MMARSLRAIAVAATLVFMGTAAEAQQGWVSQSAPRGWIGIQFEVLTTSDAGGTRSTVVVTEVTPGSPAAEARLSPGDVLLSINQLDTPDELLGIRDRLRLTPGDSVRIRLSRDGVQRSVKLWAAPSPEDVAFGQSFTFEFQADSMAETIYRAMDSLRIRMVRSQGSNLQVVDPSLRGVTVLRTRERGQGPVVAVPPLPDPSTDVWVTREVRAPFEFRIFQGEAYDSLLAEADRLNATLRPLLAQEAARSRALGSADRRGSAGEERELALLRESIEAFQLQGERIQRAMVEAARSSATAAAYGVASSPRSAEAPPVADVAEFRPLTPYLLGRDRALGAKVMDIEPELARYFEATEGVLVVEVPESTPAHEAGLRAGDVIVRIEGRRVRSVDALRAGLASASGPLPITLLRKGDSLQVVLGR